MNIWIKLNGLKDYDLLYRDKNRTYNRGDSYIIDLSNHGFLMPEQIIFLTLFIINVKNKGYSVSVTEPLDTNVRAYFQDIGIKEFCRTNYQQPKDINRIASRTAMPLRRLNSETMNEYIIRAIDHISQYCKNKSLQFLYLSISELVNNVDNHAHSPIDAYIFCQFFPNLNIIKISIGDSGIGIPASVNSYLSAIEQNSLSSLDCLKWALSENKSVKSTLQNRGVGLYNLSLFIKENHGEMTILSNDAKVSIKANEDKFEDNPIIGFNGTIVTLSIVINNLPDKDPDDLIDIY